MKATRAKQALKNGIYRAIGETVAGAGALDGEGGRTLRALMYHKVNDIPGNPVTVPTSQFDEQMAQLRELGYRAVGLDAVVDHYAHGEPLPRPDPACSDPEADLEEPIHLLLTASSRVALVPQATSP